MKGSFAFHSSGRSKDWLKFKNPAAAAGPIPRIGYGSIPKSRTKASAFI
jgi:hypothetical protein